MLRIIPIKELTNTVKASNKCDKNDNSICIRPDDYGDMVNMSIEISEQQILEGAGKGCKSFVKENKGKVWFIELLVFSVSLKHMSRSYK